MYSIGIDIGSTSAKVAVFDIVLNKFSQFFILPTGWNIKETSQKIQEQIGKLNLKNLYFTATGYGRISVSYADKIITKITAHGTGANYLSNKNYTVIDIGGQDTKAIKLENGEIVDFTMNDKCSAGTGKFIEITANRLNADLTELTRLALNSDENIAISSMCTVFAESEIISLIAQNFSKENIANAIINSVIEKVVNLVKKTRK